MEKNLAKFFIFVLNNGSSLTKKKQLIKNKNILRQSSLIVFVDQQMQSNQNYKLVINPSIDIYIKPMLNVLNYLKDKLFYVTRYFQLHLLVVMMQMLSQVQILTRKKNKIINTNKI